MRTLGIALLAVAAYAPQLRAQATAWWTPTVEFSPAMPVAWWPVCDCGNCGDDAAQKKAYGEAYDRALRENKALVLFVGCPQRTVSGAVVVRWDKAQVPKGLSTPAVIVGRPCTADKLNQTATLPGSCTDSQISEALKVQPNCPASQPVSPFRVSEAEFNGLPAMLAAAAIGAMSTEQEPCFGPECFAPGPVAWRGTVPMQVGTSTFGGSGWTSGQPVAANVYYGRRFRPFQRLANAIRAARAARLARRTPVAPQPVETVQATTVTRYEWKPVATYSLQPVTESVPVTKYRWVEMPLKN